MEERKTTMGSTQSENRFWRSFAAPELIEDKPHGKKFAMASLSAILLGEIRS